MSAVVRGASIRARLLLGFGVVVLLLVLAGVSGWTSINSVSGATQTALRGVEQDARLSAKLATDVAREVAVAERYVAGASDRATLEAFDSLLWRTHHTQRELRRRPHQTGEEVALVVGIDQALSEAEVRYVAARRLAEMGRAAEAGVQADSARAIEAGVLADLDRLAGVKANRVALAAEELRGSTWRRALFLVVLLVGALAIAVSVVVVVIRSISEPLGALSRHAVRLGEGDLGARTAGRLPSELEVLATAMNRTSASLSRIGAGAAEAADHVTLSAQELLAVASQLGMAVQEVTESVAAVSGGAEEQVAQLRRVDAALRAMRRQAEQVAGGVREVTGLAGEIESVALAKRTETGHTLAVLLKVREQVRAAAAETEALNASVAEFGSFVETVNRIAEQTNLLGLNASIEAARAGEQGAGFAVVAEEVRKLAGQARAGAESVATITRAVTERVDSTARAMAAGASHVDEIERVAHTIEEALSTIAGAAERTRRAADGVASAAEENTTGAVDAARGVALVTERAEEHAALAEGVRAATTQQEGACALTTETTEKLLDRARQLRALVGGLRVDEGAESGGSVSSAEAAGSGDDDDGDDEPDASVTSLWGFRRARRRRKLKATA